MSEEAKNNFSCYSESMDNQRCLNQCLSCKEKAKQNQINLTMKEKLRTEAEKFVESILAYPTQINFTKSELTQYLLDFHAQQSKERGIITPKEFILSKYPDANFEDKNGFINGNFWKGIESMISEYCALTK